MIEARFHIPLGPGDNRIATLENMLNSLAEANAAYFADHPEAPCCLASAGVTYYDPPVGRCQNFWSAPDVLRRGRASCADAAAYETGMKLAEGHRSRVALEPIDGISLHAVTYTGGQRIDPSAELEGAPHRQQPRCDQVSAVGRRHSPARAANDRGQRFSVAGPSLRLVHAPVCSRDFHQGRRVSRAASQAIDRVHRTHQAFEGIS